MPKLSVRPMPWGANYSFHCAGCGFPHGIQSRTDGNGPSWTFNGDLERPTFTPSILVTWDGPIVAAGEDHGTGPDVRHVCHLFLTDGKLHFLGDCTHKLAGQVVDLPDIE
jgi:hypothetical protein